MRLAAVTLLIALGALAAPAAAATVARRTPAVGPVFAGAKVAWGEETRAGGVRIRTGTPVATVHRVPAPTARRTDRGFFHTPWSLAASGTHLAAIVHTSTVTQSGPDFVSTTSTSAAIGGAFGALGLLAGSLPARGDAACDGTRRSPEAVAVDGDRIAFAELTFDCDLPETRSEITISGGGATTTVVAAENARVVQLRLAGRHLAWVVNDRRLVVRDLLTNAETTLTRFTIGDLDVDPEGRVAFTFSRNAGPRRLAILEAGRLRVLDRRVADRGVALAAGRVLYEKLDRGDFRSRLLVRGLAGGTRRLATFTPRRRRIGGLDLDATRAAWATLPTRPGYEGRPTGPARIISRRL